MGNQRGRSMSYRCNGSGRDTYIANEDVLQHGKVEPLISARWSKWSKNEEAKRPTPPVPPIGTTEGKPIGYTGHVRGRKNVDAVAKSFGALTSRRLEKKKSRPHNLFFNDPSEDRYCLTSREYGAEQEYDTKHSASGSVTAREPRIRPQGSNHYPCNTLPVISSMHSPGRAPPPPRITQRSSTMDATTKHRSPDGGSLPPSEVALPRWCDNVTGYAGYKPRFPVRVQSGAPLGDALY